MKKSMQLFNKLSFEILKYFYFLCQPVLTANGLRLKKVGDFEVQTFF